MASPAKEDDEIHNLVKQCGRLFKELQAILSDRPGNQFLIALEYEQRFQQWSEDLGLSVDKPPVSIFARLGPHRGLYQVILELLQMLDVNLGRVVFLESATDKEPTAPSVQSWLAATLQPFSVFKSASRTDIQPSELAPATIASLDAIQSAIARLTALTALLPPLSSTKYEPSTYDDDDDDTDRDGHWSISTPAIIRLTVTGIIQSRFPKIDISLARRLEASILVRRRTLRQRHPELHQHDPQSDRLFNPIQVSDVPISQEEQPEDVTISPTLVATISPSPPLVVYKTAEIEITENDLLQRLIWGLKEPPVPRVLTDKRAFFKPPKLVGDAVTIQEELIWRQRCMDDLRPYVCLTTCSEPAPTFATMDQWIGHMVGRHTPNWIAHVGSRTSWYCDLDHTNRETFSSAVELERHIKSIHQERNQEQIPRVQVANMLENNVLVTAGDPKICPICLETPQSKEVDSMPDHIARHLMSFAWLSIRHFDGAIPATSQDQEGDFGSKGAEFGSVARSDSVSLSGRSSTSRSKHLFSNPMSQPLPRAAEDNFHSEDSPRLAEFGSVSDHADSSMSAGQDGADSSEFGGPRFVDFGMFTDPARPSSRAERWILKPAHESSDNRAVPGTSFMKPYPLHSREPSRSPEPATEGLADPKTTWPIEPDSSTPDDHRGHDMSTQGQMSPDTLGMLILKSLVKSQLDAQSFLPRSRINSLITPRNVHDVLDLTSLKDHESIHIVDFVSREAPILFAVMVLIGVDLAPAATAAYRFGLTDKLLPISMEAFENLNDKNSNQSRESPKHLDAFRHAPWSYRRVSMFFQQQWSFLAPVFTTESFQSFKLHSRAIFPFIYLDTGRRSSFFSDVYKVKIHPDHIKGPLERDEHIAVKELRSPEDLTREFDLDKSFETETHALDEVSALRHPNLVSAIAVIERANKRFFLFPWAGGGNLREFWADNNIWPLTPNLILLVLEQLHGLCDALTKIHGISWRHGDVKPENILRFGDDTVVGNLRLGDLGLAKKHDHDTGLRHEPTETRVGTVRYEPPEAVLATNAPRSRRYDIWSMGCIILEFIIWLQYGPEGLRKFTRGSERYFTITSEMGKTRVELHHVVQTWLDHMRDDPDWPEGTALGDLVQFVRTRMLVVIPAPPIRSMPLNLMIPSSSDDHLPAAPGDRSRKSESRVDSNALSSKTLQICGLSRADEAYLFPDAVRGRQSRRDTPTPKQNPTSLDVPPDLGLTGPEDISPLLITRMAPRLDEYRFAISNVWEFEADNQFALSFAKSAPDLALPTTPKQSESLRLCDNCRKLDVCNPRFHVAYKASYLENNTTARRCDLCTLLYNATAASNMPLIHVVDFKKMGSVLFVNEGPPVLSIVAELEAVRSISFSPKLPPDIQLSYSTLPDPRSAISAQLVREWVRSCDTDHQCMSETTVPGLPKRLLSTNYQVEGGVRLCNTAGMDPRIRYTALSFCWGNKKHVKTTMSNITEFEQGIEYNQLDKTFQDAILVTHQLGIQYLWLDMFCIIQDSYEDLFQAVREIGTYFNNAYCVLVASSAPDPTGGLLMPRRQRKSIPIQEVDGVPISICELVDDFQKDVIASPHASRAWTLQERVLARRTIFFTATQMYWQCGEGIRCETLIKMHNPLASIILGSSNFPESALKRMSPIRVFTELYEHYSRLLLTYQTDRALALMSLESRLLQALGTAGGYGVLERFLGQSLLWRGDSKDRMARIDMPSAPRRPVPSWSWMAYTGGITYFAVPPQFALGSVKAFFDVLDADLTEAEQRETLALDGQTLPFAISYPSLAARTLKLDRSKVTTIFYDLVRNEDRDGQECVIVGTSKGPQLALYLLIVAPIEHSEEYRRERLGVGYAECDDMASFGIPESLVEIL